MRIDGRRNDQLRPVKITPGYIDYPEGSALIEAGKTRVLCAASVQAGVPRWLEGQGRGSGRGTIRLSRREPCGFQREREPGI